MGAATTVTATGITLVYLNYVRDFVGRQYGAAYLPEVAGDGREDVHTGEVHGPERRAPRPAGERWISLARRWIGSQSSATSQSMRSTPAESPASPAPTMMVFIPAKV